MEIECEFSITSGYTCKVLKASITKQNIEIVSINGKHQPGKSNKDVSDIYFENVKVEFFPRNLQKIFPNLKTLAIKNCGLKEISREDLIGLEKLVDLCLTNNEIKSLPDDLFSNMPNLKQVWLSYNEIEFASSKLIEPIVRDQLERFNLRNNTSIDEYFSKFSNLNCKTIQELMAKIDEKCKPPKPQMKVAHHETIYYAAEEIFKCFNEFRLLGRYTDFVIIVGSKEFPVNKIVLAAQSSVFAEMFEVKTNGRFASKLEISELSVKAVEAFLDYLYERKQPAKDNAVELFKLAAKYEVAKLKANCEEIIRESLDESNAFEIFKLSCGPHKSDELKVAAFKKLQEKCGNDLADEMINHPEKIQKLVELRRQIDALMKEDQE